MEERGLALAFHSGPNWQEPVFRACNRFISVHALGFSFYNILHCTNWVINGMCERFPKLPVIWIEGGLAWIPFLMQRLDNEFMMRPSESCTTSRSDATPTIFRISRNAPRRREPICEIRRKSSRAMDFGFAIQLAC